MAEPTLGLTLFLRVSVEKTLGGSGSGSHYQRPKEENIAHILTFIAEETSQKLTLGN